MIETSVCNQFKLDVSEGLHQPGDSYRIALYTEDAVLGPETKAYTRENEVEGPGYDIGGKSLTGRRVVMVRGVACWTFNDPIWDNATFSAAGALIYNASRGNAALATFDFGQTLHPTNGEFALEFPLPTPESAAIAIF